MSPKNIIVNAHIMSLLSLLVSPRSNKHPLSSLRTLCERLFKTSVSFAPCGPCVRVKTFPIFRLFRKGILSEFRFEVEFYRSFVLLHAYLDSFSLTIHTSSGSSLEYRATPISMLVRFTTGSLDNGADEGEKLGKAGKGDGLNRASERGEPGITDEGERLIGASEGDAFRIPASSSTSSPW